MLSLKSPRKERDGKQDLFIHSGFVDKKNPATGLFQPRFLLLSKDAISWSKNSRNRGILGYQRGHISLGSIRAVDLSENDLCTFVVTRVTGGSRFFRCSTIDSCNEWLKVLNTAVYAFNTSPILRGVQMMSDQIDDDIDDEEIVAVSQVVVCSIDASIESILCSHPVWGQTVALHETFEGKRVTLATSNGGYAVLTSETVKANSSPDGNIVDLPVIEEGVLSGSYLRVKLFYRVSTLPIGTSSVPSSTTSDHQKRDKWTVIAICGIFALSSVHTFTNPSILSLLVALLSFVLFFQSMRYLRVSFMASDQSKQSQIKVIHKRDYLLWLIGYYPSSGNVVENSSNESLKQGRLQRQVTFNQQTKNRFFVASKNGYLHEYVDVGDGEPRSSVLLFGWFVSDAVLSPSNDTYCFTLIDPLHSASIVLSCIIEKEAQEWVQCLRRLSELVPSVQVNGISNSESAKTAFETISPCSVSYPVNPSDTFQGLNKAALTAVERIVNTMLASVSPRDTAWEPLFERSGVTAYRKVGEVMTVRGDCIVSEDILSIFELVMNVQNANVLNPSIVEQKILREMSYHTSYHYLRFPRVWPVAARDFFVMAHWRLLPTGQIVIVTFPAVLACKEDEERLCPPVDGLVRASLQLGGYLLTPCPGGTNVQFVTQVDLKGTIPTSITNMVATTQPMTAGNIANYFKNNKKFTPYRSREKVTYDEVFAIMSRGYHRFEPFSSD